MEGDRGIKMITKNGYVVKGIKKTVSEALHVPKGTHVEIWAVVDETKKQIVLYTSDYLSQNSWTLNHGDDECRFERYADYAECSLTSQIKTWLNTIE